MKQMIQGIIGLLAYPFSILGAIFGGIIFVVLVVIDIIRRRK